MEGLDIDLEEMEGLDIDLEEETIDLSDTERIFPPQLINSEGGLAEEDAEVASAVSFLLPPQEISPQSPPRLFVGGRQLAGDGTDDAHFEAEPPSPSPATHEARATRVEEAIRVVDEANTSLESDKKHDKMNPFVAAAATGSVPEIAAALAAGVEPNHEGDIQMKVRGGLWPKWTEIWVSLQGGMVVRKADKASEEDMGTYSMLKADNVELKSEKYVTCVGGLPGNDKLELYHDDPSEAVLWFVALECSRLLAKNATSLAMKTPPQVISWWENKLQGLEARLENGLKTFRTELHAQATQAVAASASVVDYAKSTAQGATERALTKAAEINEKYSLLANASQVTFVASYDTSCES